MKLLLIQNDIYENVQDNIKHLQDMFKDIDEKDVDVICFAEMFTTPYQLDYFKKNKQDMHGPVMAFLKQIALKFQAIVIGGSIPENDQGKIFNTSFVINAKGEIIHKYRKIHLFSLTYPNGQHFNEADVLSAGKNLCIVNTKHGKLGLIICFDIRFPELIKKYRQAGCKFIFVPAAFNTYTGPMHWYTSFRARAIDNQIFMVGVSPSRHSFGSYQPYGHSLVVDPYGRVLQSLGENEAYMVVNIDNTIVQEARDRIPIIKNEKDLSFID